MKNNLLFLSLISFCSMYGMDDFYEFNHKGVVVCVAKGFCNKKCQNNNKAKSDEDILIPMQSIFRYGRYCFNYQKDRHEEGIIYPYLSWWEPRKVLDVRENYSEVKNILASLYRDALVDRYKKIADDPGAHRKIVVLPLGTLAGFPKKMTIPIAVKAVYEFIEENPTAYSKITLSVKKRSTVKEYEKLFKAYSEKKEIWDFLY